MILLSRYLPPIDAYRSLSIVNEYTIEMNKYYFHATTTSSQEDQSIFIYLLEDVNNPHNRKKLLTLKQTGQIFFSFGMYWILF
jgi:hypothetical protein